MKRQTCFIYLSFRIAFFILFLRKRLIRFLYGLLLLCYLFLYENSRSQMFYKADALKDLAIFTGIHLYWRIFLINFIKKSLQHMCFPFNITKCLSAAPIHYTFQKFYVMIEFFGCLRVQNWYFSYFLYHCFVFIHNSRVIIGSPLLFRIYLVLYQKIY